MAHRPHRIALLLLTMVVSSAACAGLAPASGPPVPTSLATEPASIASPPDSEPSRPPLGSTAPSTEPPIACPDLTFDPLASLDPLFQDEIFLRDESDAIAAAFVEGLERYYQDPVGSDPCALFTSQGIASALRIDARFDAVARGDLRIVADLQYRARFEGSHDLRARPPTVPLDVIFDVAPGAATHAPPDGPVTSTADAERIGLHIDFAFDGHRWLADRVGPISDDYAMFAVLPAPVPPGQPCQGFVRDRAAAPFDDDGADRVWCDDGGNGSVLQASEQVHLSTRYWCDVERAAILTIGRPVGARIDPLQRFHYVRDPDDVFLGLRWIAEPFEADVELPTAAVPTGWSNGNIDLWVSPVEIERAVYLQRGERFERWPRAAPTWGVTDCN